MANLGVNAFSHKIRPANISGNFLFGDALWRQKLTSGWWAWRAPWTASLMHLPICRHPDTSERKSGACTSAAERREVIVDDVWLRIMLKRKILNLSTAQFCLGIVRFEFGGSRIHLGLTDANVVFASIMQQPYGFAQFLHSFTALLSLIRAILVPTAIRILITGVCEHAISSRVVIWLIEQTQLCAETCVKPRAMSTLYVSNAQFFSCRCSWWSSIRDVRICCRLVCSGILVQNQMKLVCFHP